MTERFTSRRIDDQTMFLIAMAPWIVLGFTGIAIAGWYYVHG